MPAASRLDALYDEASFEFGNRADHRDAARVAVEFCKKFSNRVLDPFCGHGTTLHVAEELGMDSVGVDIDPQLCGVAETFVTK